MRVWAWLTQVCPADGKIRLATLELSCLLLKQQVVASTGCIIKDVHLACLEVRPVPAMPAPQWGEVAGKPLHPGCSWSQVCKAPAGGRQATDPLPAPCPLVPTDLPFHRDGPKQPTD